MIDSSHCLYSLLPSILFHPSQPILPAVPTFSSMVVPPSPSRFHLNPPRYQSPLPHKPTPENQPSLQWWFPNPHSLLLPTEPTPVPTFSSMVVPTSGIISNLVFGFLLLLIAGASAGSKYSYSFFSRFRFFLFSFFDGQQHRLQQQQQQQQNKMRNSAKPPSTSPNARLNSRGMVFYLRKEEGDDERR